MPQASPAPYPQSTPPPTKPKGAVGIWIGILLIIGGIVLGIVLIVAGARSLIDSFGRLERVPINGGGQVQIDDTGTQTIFVERPYAGGGTSFSTGNANFSGFTPNITVTITAPDGSEPSITSMFGSTTYTHDGREGRSIGEFYASVEGTYDVRVTGGENAQPYTTVAVGKWIDPSGIIGIIGGIFGGGAVVLLGIVLVIIFAVRRSRSKKRIAAASAPYGAYGAAPGAGWPTPPGGAPGQTWQPPAAAGWVPPPTVPGAVPPPAAQPPAAQPWQPPASTPQQPGFPGAPPPPAAPPWQPPGQAAPPPPADAPPPQPADPSPPSGWPPAAPPDDPTT